MADDSISSVFLGSAVGFGLYLLVKGLGLGGRGTATRQPDTSRLTFVMTSPTAKGEPASFQLRGDPTSYSVDAVIARVREGGRSDIELKVTGAVLQGPWATAREQIKQSGLTVFEIPSAAVGRGYHRGYYAKGLRR